MKKRKLDKHPYVVVSYLGSDKAMLWPYLEAQEFSTMDLSDSVIYLTDKERYIIEEVLREERKKNG